jgi:hypothetical protein
MLFIDAFYLFFWIPGYFYAREKALGNRIYWACKDRRPYKCGARLSQLTDDNKIIILNNQHNHPIITRKIPLKNP